jgi:predicted transcriptional regulator
MTAKESLMTAGNIAKDLGIPPAKVKKFIEENKIKPDESKGACKYYGPKTYKKIKSGLK